MDMTGNKTNDGSAFAKAWRCFLNPCRQGSSSSMEVGARSVFQQDFDRIIFSSAFRRLKDKTQVFPLSRSDYVRTRLTHSLEASCVARSLGAAVGKEIIARYQLQDIESADFGAITAAAALAHDIGNPPFGHAGEDAIRQWFKKHLQDTVHNNISEVQRLDLYRYEGNAQGFRIVTRLQSPTNPGMQLTYAVLGAFTKYPQSSLFAEQNNTKFGFFQNDADTFSDVAKQLNLPSNGNGLSWQRHPLALLVEVADDTCYLIVDVEDAARLRQVNYDEAEDLLLAIADMDKNNKRLANMQDKQDRLAYLRAKAIGRVIDCATSAFLDHEKDIVCGNFCGPLLPLTDVAQPLNAIRQLAMEKIYTAAPAIETEIAGFRVISELLSAFNDAVDIFPPQTEPSNGTRERMLRHLLPSQFLGKNRVPVQDPYVRLLQIADFVSGMTDSYAIEFYRKLTGINLPH